MSRSHLSILLLLLAYPAVGTAQVQLFDLPNACAGAWLGSLKLGAPSPGLVAQYLLTPADPAGRMLTFFGNPVNPFPTMGHPLLFPRTTVVTGSFGTARRTGPDMYALKWIAYGTRPATGETSWFRAEIQYIMVQETVIECREDTLIERGMFHAYSAINDPAMIIPGLLNGVTDQDKDDDGFPDANEKPILSFPVEWTLKRFR